MGASNYAHFRDEFNFCIDLGLTSLNKIADRLGVQRDSLITRIKRYGLTEQLLELRMQPRTSGSPGGNLAYVLHTGARMPARPNIAPIARPGASGEASAVYGRGQGTGSVPE